MKSKIGRTWNDNVVHHDGREDKDYEQDGKKLMSTRTRRHLFIREAVQPRRVISTDVLLFKLLLKELQRRLKKE